jgi:hypothetical protein
MSESKRKDLTGDDTKVFKDSNEANKKLKTEKSAQDQPIKMNKIHLNITSSISTVCIYIYENIYPASWLSFSLY